VGTALLGSIPSAGRFDESWALRDKASLNSPNLRERAVCCTFPILLARAFAESVWALEDLPAFEFLRPGGIYSKHVKCPVDGYRYAATRCH